jgi:uncharacterized protein
LDWPIYALIILAGAVAGFINTLAGSGSLITLPLLIYAGLPATVANGTNRVAILMQTLVSVGSFRQGKALDTRGLILLSIPAVVGSIIGAQIAVRLDETAMRRAIGFVMVLMMLIILLKPERWLVGKLEQIHGSPGWLQYAIFFLIGIYGGFIQAGVGILLLVALVLGIGYNLVRANAIKNGIVGVYTIFALWVFIFNGHVDWLMGLILTIGNVFGAWIAARLAVKEGAAIWIHRLLVVIVVVSAADLLGLFGLIQDLIHKI